ncbi:MAG TPA: RICIN domain-containing protein [Actinoplanes sp.]|nr:RICIN domain-containing protein [Actinoplanes sp.]
MGDELGGDRDPLLVRPFVLPDGDRHGSGPSASTWPAQPQLGEQATQLLPAVPAAAAEPGAGDGSQRWRSLVLIGAGVAVVASIGGYALLRPAEVTGEWVSQPGLSLPAAVGPSVADSETVESEPGGGVPDDGLPGGDSGSNGGGQGPSTVNRTRTPAAGGGTVSPSAVVSPPAGTSASVGSAPVVVVPTVVPTGRGMLVNGSGLCLDLRGGRAGQGREVHVDTCNGTSPQRWRLNADRSLEVLDMCAQVVRGGTVELTRCDGRLAAQWQLFSNGALVSGATALCLTDMNSGNRPATAVVVSFCAGGQNQAWTFG